MNIFVCEYVTGGGLYREPLPASLAREGDMMLGALLGDLGVLPQVQLLTTRDARLPPLAVPVDVIVAGGGADIWQCWEDCLRQADAVWPIAPESGGALERLSRLAVQHGKVLLGSSPAAVALAASKYATSATLAVQQVATVPTFRPAEISRELCGPWVAKPDDGAGCDDTCYFEQTSELMPWLRQGRRMQTHVVQPYLQGEAASLSMLCHAGEARLLACNRQLIALQQGRFSYHGSELNGMLQHWTLFERLAQEVTRALPGLSGYVGVDVVLSDGEATVIEVNPRLTTSYVGLGRAMGCNPARLVLELLYNDGFQSFPDIARNVVKVSIDA